MSDSLGRLTRVVDNGDAALFAEGRIGQHHLVFAVFPGKRMFGDDGQILFGLSADAGA